MAIHVTEQLRTFLLSILLGLGAGVLYDLLRAVRLRHPRLTAPLDLLYCQAVGLAVFLFVLRQSDGQLRGFILLGGLGGGVLFFSLLSRPLRPVWDFWMDRWMELFQFLSLPGRFCAAVCKKFAFQAKTLFYFLRKYATIHIEGVWKPLRKGGMSHGKARQTRKKEKIRSDIAEGPTEEKMKELAREELGMIDSNSYLFLDRSN